MPKSPSALNLTKNSDNAAPRGVIELLGPPIVGLFAYSGQLKTGTLLGWFPVDLTLLAGMAVALLMTHSRFRQGPAASGLVFPLILWTTFLLGGFGASLSGYSLDKSLSLGTTTLLAAFAPFYLIRTERHVRDLLATIFLLTFVTALSAFLQGESASDYARISSFEGTTTIGTARMAGAGLIISAAHLAVTRESIFHRVFSSTAAAFFFVVMLQSGSRGPFLGLLVALVVVLVTAKSLRPYRGRAIVASTLAALLAIIWAVRSGGDGANRVLGFFAGARDTSTAARQYMWRIAYENIGSPIGVGWGDFNALPGMGGLAGPGVRSYPHNILLEISVEAGAIAGGVFVLAVVIAFSAAIRQSFSPTGTAVLALLVFHVTNAMVSGDIVDNRVMWVLLSIGWAASIQRVRRPMYWMDRPSSSWFYTGRPQE